MYIKRAYTVDPHQCGDCSEVQSKTMQRLFKTIGVVGILTLSLVALVNTDALLRAEAASSIHRDAKESVCVNALNRERTGWDQRPNFSKWVAEAKRRGFTPDFCNRVTASTAPHPSCKGILARPEIQNFAATALNRTKQDLHRNVPMERLNTTTAMEKFFLHMRDVLNADPRYSKVYNIDNDGLDRVMAAMLKSTENNSREFIACFPQVWELAVSTKTFEQEFKHRQEEARIEAAKPINKLKQAYFNYMVVKRCYEVRLGYQLVYINEIEMDRARVAVNAIETSASKEDSSINTNDAWESAVRAIRASTQHVEQYFCQKTYNDLLSAAPYSPPEKDFGIQRN